MSTEHRYPQLHALRADAPLPTICYVQIHKADDDALLVNGKVLLSFEPSIDNESCLQMGKDLAALLRLPLDELIVDVSSAIEDWNWEEIEAFISQGCRGDRYRIVTEASR
jgi:hypothetical protein